MSLDQDNSDLDDVWGQDYLVFSLAGQEYGLDFEKVRDTYDYGSQEVTPVADAPAYLDGAMRLGAAAIPIVNLRARLGLAPREPNLPSKLVLLEIGGQTLGVVVDHVDGMLILQSWQISKEVSPAAPAADCLIGTGTAGSRVLTLVDAQVLLGREATRRIGHALA